MNTFIAVQNTAFINKYSFQRGKKQFFLDHLSI